MPAEIRAARMAFLLAMMLTFLLRLTSVSSGEVPRTWPLIQISAPGSLAMPLLSIFYIGFGV